MSSREKLRSILHHRARPVRDRPRRVIDMGVVPLSHSSKLQQAAEDAVETETPQQHERAEFGTEL